VAADFERRWNVSLDAVSAQERQVAALTTTTATPPVDLAALRAFAEDLPRV
jgi:hypothetical protein